MYNILVVEDTAVVRKILAKLIGSNPYFRCVMCQDLAAAKEALKQDIEFLAAVVDLNLPDAPEGEVVDEVLQHDIPVVVLTGNFDERVRSSLLNRGVLDYITKDCRYAFNQVVKTIDRIRKNLTTKALVVDDSVLSSNIMCSLLRKAKIEVITAGDGLEALQILDSTPGINLVISDQHMPKLEGCDLVKTLRNKPNFANVVFIGVSTAGDEVMSAKFIKSGANDFLKKPFYHEEFYWRVFSSLDTMDMMETIRQAANIDPLTGINNRRHLFDMGERIFSGAQNSSDFTACMLDLDEFKQVNDSLGHRIGDQLIVQFAKILKGSFDEDLIGRYGGEEFVILSTRKREVLKQDLEQFMRVVRSTLFTEKNLAVTCSIGVSDAPMSTLSETLEVADQLLYLAKGAGRNRVEPFDSEAA